MHELYNGNSTPKNIIFKQFRINPYPNDIKKDSFVFINQHIPIFEFLIISNPENKHVLVDASVCGYILPAEN